MDWMDRTGDKYNPAYILCMYVLVLTRQFIMDECEGVDDDAALDRRSIFVPHYHLGTCFDLLKAANNKTFED